VVTFLAIAAARPARSLRTRCHSPDSDVRAKTCASPRTQDCERRFAVDRIVVYRRSVGETASRAKADNMARRALDDASVVAPIALPFLAKRLGDGSRRGRRHGRRVGPSPPCGRAELTLGARALDGQLDAVGGATGGTLGRHLPRACARARWAVTRHREHGQARNRNHPVLTACQAIRTIDHSKRHRPGRHGWDRPKPALPVAAPVAPTQRNGGSRDHPAKVDSAHMGCPGNSPHWLGA
jgi:hypothetical protein